VTNLFAHATQMAKYNQWMNTKLYGAAALLTDEQRKRDLGAFFGSLHGTFNHLLATDRIWLSRFEDTRNGVTALNEILYTDYELLSAARREMDKRINEWVLTLKLPTPETLTYRKMSGMQAEVSLPFDTCVVHWFNHQTHHRGQATALMMQLGLDPGVTDLIAMP
jgi:uncharacterized damage-inducible protein DinB